MKGKRVGSSVLFGMIVELYLDHCFSFPRGSEWVPALVMLGICLSILAAALLERVERFLGKIRRTVQVYEMIQSAKEISSQLSTKNGCSFSENACILGDECREALAHPVCSGKRRRKVVAFSRGKTGRGLRNVC